jgi:U3 small nucleolar RNA-associated protein 14
VPTASGGPSRKNNTLSTSTEAKAVRNLKKAAGKASAQDLAEEDERVEIDLDAANLGQPTKRKGNGKAMNGKGGVQSKKRADDGEGEDEDEDELMPTSGVKAFSQRDLVAEAFAGDNVVEVSEVQLLSTIVFITSHPIIPSRCITSHPIASRPVAAYHPDDPRLALKSPSHPYLILSVVLAMLTLRQDFALEKARQIEADAPKTEDTSLPGWGSWGGKGLRKRGTNPKFLIKTAGIEPSNRKDFGNQKVIITEKKDRKAAQFLVKDLPYPYTSVAQYEASFNSPVGAEWNSRKVHQKETTPRVVKKVSTR